MSERERKEDTSVRDAISALLYASNLIPVLPLIEIISQYTLPFRGVVTTVEYDEFSHGWNGAVRVVYAKASAGVGASLLIADQLLPGFFQFFPSTGYVARLAGTQFGHVCGRALTDARFQYAHGICVDPLNPNRFYLCDMRAIYVLDRTNGDAASGGTVSLLAGSGDAGYVDGAGSNARFHSIADMVCTSDGLTLYAADSRNRRICGVSTKTGVVATRPIVVARADGLKCLAFDRTTEKPDSVLFVALDTEISRVDLSTDTVRAIPTSSAFVLEKYSDAPGLEMFDDSPPAERVLRPFGIACAPNGWVLFTCDSTNALYAVDPGRGGACEPEWLAGNRNASGRADGSALDGSQFDQPTGLCVVDDERCAYVADARNRTLRRVTLPPHLFTSPTVR